MDISDGESSYSLVGFQNVSDPIDSPPNQKQSNNLVIILGSSIVLLILAFVAILAFMFLRAKRKSEQAQISENEKDYDDVHDQNQYEYITEYYHSENHYDKPVEYSREYLEIFENVTPADSNSVYHEMK